MNRKLESQEESDLGSSLLQTRNFVFFGLFAITVLVFFSTFQSLLKLSLSYHEHYSHIVLIPFISLYFFFTERIKIFKNPVLRRWIGLIPLLLGTLAALFGRYANLAFNANNSLSFNTSAFILCFWGIFVLTYGTKITVKALFPLGFLLWIIPLPDFILEWIIEKLLWGSTIATNWLFSLTGIPFLNEGAVFTLPGLSIQIAEVCSGIRSSIALAITGILAARLFLKKWWSRTLLIIALFPLAVFKNGVRIVSLSLLTIYVDEGFMSGNLHREGGIFFFIITLILMGLYLGVLKLAERKVIEFKSHSG
jgi:exosortase